MDSKEKQVVDFLTTHKLCVVSVLLKDGSPHSATVHFSNTVDLAKIYILTDRTYRKCEALLGGDKVAASFVTGFDDNERKTVQMDGSIRLVADEKELVEIKKVHFTKIPSAQKYEDDPDTVFLEFTPTWWRYTDYTTNPETKVSSKE